MPQPCNAVIFGASGDLTFRKLIPALYNLAADGDLPGAANIIGFARREKTDESWRTELKDTTAKCSRSGLNEDIWGSFSKRVYYHRSEFGDPSGYKALAERLDALDAASGTRGNRLFYLSVSPTEYEGIFNQIAAAGLNKPRSGAWTRVIVEKPFGTDLSTAQELNRQIARAFPERDTYRIDHYLGKETAQNIMVLRFANSILEPLWNHRYVDHVQITSAETLGVEGRGPYYDKAGALRDMVQSHLVQLLCLTAMEPPTSLSADAVRDEKVKVVRALRPLKSDSVGIDVIRGQYGAGSIGGKIVPAYRTEDRVDPKSETETFVALRMHVDNWRGAVQGSARGSFQHGGNAARAEPARDSHPAGRRRVAAPAMQGAGKHAAHRAGEDGFSLRHELWKTKPRGIRAAHPRCDERRRDFVCAARRSGGGVALCGCDRKRMAQQRGPAAAV